MNDSCSTTSIEEEIAIAHRALGEGDLGHAAFHIAAALVEDPAHPEAVAIFDGWFGAADNPVGLVSGRDNDNWVGWLAMRARAHAKLGHTAEALRLLTELAAFDPEKAYLSWLPLLRGVGQVDDRSVLHATHSLFRLALELREPLGAGAPARPTAEAAVALLAEWRETKRTLAPPLHALTILLRKLGKLREALAAARALNELRPDWSSAATLSSTLRVAGNLEEALEVARRGADLAPDDSRAAPLLDVGDLCLELERPGEASEAYAASLQLEPHNAWGQASLLYARFLERGDEADREALRRFVGDHPNDGRARALLRAIGEPLFEQPVSPTDATANALRHLQGSFREKPPQEPIQGQLALSAPEGPSNFVAARAMAAAFGQPFAMGISVSDIPDPDPRQTLPGADPALFRRAGDAWEAALPPPDAAVAREVAAIAQTRYALSAWAEQSRILGEALGPERAHELLSVMAHGAPLPSTDDDAPDWIQSLQVAAALALAHVDHGWEGSTRRRLLLAVARGPVDWTVSAAIVALIWVALHEQRAIKDVEALFAELRDREPRGAGCTYDVTLRHAWLKLPGITAARRAELEAELAQRSNQPDEPEAQPEPEPPSAAAPTPALPAPAQKRGFYVKLTAWGLWLSGLALPRLWPRPLGDYWILPSVALIGTGLFVWLRSVKPLTRGEGS